MTEKLLITTIDKAGVARLTMNRPEVKNAFNEDLIEEICEAMGRLSNNNDVRAIILTGAGDAFSAGGDLKMMARVAEYSASENKNDARRMAHMLSCIYHSPKPTIALVNGPALGGGVGLISACDIAIGVDTAFFSLSEVKLGLIPAVISPFVVQAIGVRHARRYFISGERFDAAKAVDLGLLHIAVDAAELDEQLAKVLRSLLTCGPDAQSYAKDLIRAVAFRMPSDAVMEDTANRIAKARASDEGKEGVNAFLEKRKPNWIKDQ